MLHSRMYQPRMDAFEFLIATILHRDGYWVETSVKVELTKEEKVAVGRASSPRWEIDVVGYSGARNELVAIECKSYLDSSGVLFRDGQLDPPERYKLFSDPRLREVVLERLAMHMVEAGRCAPGVTVRLGMATGRIASGSDRAGLHELFEAEGWLLWDDEEVRRRLEACAGDGYENDPVVVAVKVLRRQG